jgi:hypothetical protein
MSCRPFHVTMRFFFLKSHNLWDYHLQLYFLNPIEISLELKTLA